MSNYNIARSGQQLGTFPEETIREKLASGELRPDDLAWTAGMTDWQPLSQILGTGAGGPPPVGMTSAVPPAKPSNNLVPSILVTLFCCLPLGIPAIVFAAQVDSKYAAGDYEGSAASAARSKKWMWWSFGVGLAASLAYFGLAFVGAAAGAMNQGAGY